MIGNMIAVFILIALLLTLGNAWVIIPPPDEDNYIPRREEPIGIIQRISPHGG
jgi:hypothetical protein